MNEASSHGAKGGPVDTTRRVPCGECSYCKQGLPGLCVRGLLEQHTDEDR